MASEYIRMFFSLMIALLVTVYLIPLVRIAAEKIGFLDVPDGKIKNHGHAIPYLGGVAVFLGFLLSLIITLSSSNKIIPLVPGLVLLLFVGLFDDAITCKPYQKFFGQIVAALCFIKAGFYLKEQLFLHNIWSIPFSLLWILTVINAINLVDVMDGLSSLIALGASGSFLVLAIFFQEWPVACALCAFMGACLAFFMHNKPPASIYLGDAGALFIGGFLAIVPFMLPWGMYTPYGYLASFIILAIPLIELGSLIIIRSYLKIPFYRGSPHHFSHFLMRHGWNKKQILGYCAILSLLLTIAASLFVTGVISFLSVVEMAILFIILWFTVLCIPRKKRQN